MGAMEGPVTDEFDGTWKGPGPEDPWRLWSRASIPIPWLHTDLHMIVSQHAAKFPTLWVSAHLFDRHG
jgi:hypothetical protein